MFRGEFETAGFMMYVIFAVWVVVLALILERLLFWTGRRLRRRGLQRGAGVDRSQLERFVEDAEHNVSRIDGLTHLATSLGLFGTVLGISRAFFARGAQLTLAAPEVLASGMATALFTTVAGLIVFLVGQGTLFVFRWWTEAAVERLLRQIPPEEPK